MSDIIIRVAGLGKKYRLSHRRQETYSVLRDVIADKVRGFFRPRAHETASSRDVEDFWALKDVSFEVKRGEVVGFIGRNGAGKSTLLKILSRITEPTEGRVELDGRIASLLEVGTGFHPELTGRENIFLNGAILGMPRIDIKRRFDEIVAFAEVDKFLDTPVKRYSSGMYVRLAFAVAAHLEPDILIVDEVLAVGDSEFQKKCLGKMQDIGEGGRTVLFVSHNMATVNRLCQRALLLDSGRVKADGDRHTVTGMYMVADTGTTAERHWSDPSGRPGDQVARLISVRVIQRGAVCETADVRFPVEVHMTYENLQEGAQLLAGFAFFDGQGVHLFASADFAEREWAGPRPRGVFKSVCTVPGNLFSEGHVRVVAEVSTRHPVYEIHFLMFDSVAFQVVDTGEPGSVRAGWGRPIPGVLRPLCGWQTQADSLLTAGHVTPTHSATTEE